jgi:hypothetical protein
MDEWVRELAEELRKRGCGERGVRVSVGRPGLRAALEELLGWCGSVEVAAAELPPLVTASYGPVTVLGYPLGNELVSLVLGVWDATMRRNMAQRLLEGIARLEGVCVGERGAGCRYRVRLEALPRSVHLATTPDCGYCPFAFIALSSLAWHAGVRLSAYCISDDAEEGRFTAEDVVAAFATATGVEPEGVPLVVAGGGVVLGAPADSAAALARYLYELGAVEGFGSAREFIAALQAAGVLE